MTKVIILNGQGGVGKDTFKEFVKQYDKKKTGLDRIADTSMVDRVKAIATLCGWRGQKENYDRKFLYELKQLLSKYNDLPYQSVKRFIQTTFCAMLNDELIYPYIFVDAREIEDIERLVKDFNAITVLITNGKQLEYGNFADDNIYNWSYDYIIENTSTLENLQCAAETFWDEITKEERILKSLTWENFNLNEVKIYAESFQNTGGL